MAAIELGYQPSKFTPGTTAQGVSVAGNLGVDEIWLVVRGASTSVAWAYSVADNGSVDATIRQELEPGVWRIPRPANAGMGESWSVGIIKVDGAPVCSVLPVRRGA